MSQPPTRASSEPHAHAEAPRGRFRRTLVRVLIVQAVTLAFLGLLQIIYTR